MDKDGNRQKDGSGIINLTSVSIFNNDPYFVYVYKKSEKISAALYMVTDFISDSEPLKTNIRSTSLSLINDALQLITVNSSQRKYILNKIAQQTLSLMSFLQIATLSGIMSVMNHQIIRRELELFIKTIEEREAPQKLGQNFILSTEFIKDETAQSQMHKNTPFVNQRQPVHSSSDTQIKPMSMPKNTPSVPLPDIKKDRKNDRQELIIATIRAKGELSIKDLTSVIKGCSEKTIQRELLALVNAGILNKAGERRWSRYSLIV